AGKLTALAAAVELGWVKRPPTVQAFPNQTKRRQHQIRAIGGELSPGAKMELWVGPNPSGSYFGSPEELRAAWETHRDEIMQRWGSHGRRPCAWWAFDSDLEHPGYDRERSTLWRAGVLSEAERAELEEGWRQDFDAARGMDARDRREHFEHCDVPHELIEA